jgi:uncharacterized protein
MPRATAASAHLVKDPARVRELGVRKSQENMHFRTWMKSQTSARIDRLFHDAFKEIEPQIDCTECGECCREAMLQVTKAEVRRLAARADQTVEEFRAAHVKVEEGKEVLVAEPCPFLTGSRCSCYEDRPGECQSFPHLDKKQMIHRLFGVVASATFCPLAYNVLERVKREVKW